MNYIKIWEPHTKERNALIMFANLLNKFSPDRIKYGVEDTYFDYGQNWKWTTLIVNTRDAFGGYQVSPKEQEDIITCDTPDRLAELLNYYLDKEKRL